MFTCIIQYQIDPTKKSQFEQYAQNWGQAIPRCNADLVGYYAPQVDHIMIAIIFGVLPHAENKQQYLDVAVNLKPILQTTDGFISVERF